MSSKLDKTDIENNPVARASFFSRIFFTWLYPLLWRGRTSPLSLNDLYSISEEDRSDRLGDQLSSAWEDEKKRKVGEDKHPSLFRCLARIYGWKYMLLGVTAWVEECVIRVGQPLVLGYLMRYFRGEFKEEQGWLFASAFIFASIWYVTQHHPFFFQLQHNGMKMRIATSVLMYKKTLKLSQASLERASEGRIVNLLSNDVSRLDLSKDFMHYIWIAPCQLAIVVYILWGFYGWVSLVGVGILLVFIPFQSSMGKLFGKYRTEISKRTDRRLRLTNQVVKAISAIKMFVWEVPFYNQINDARKDEVKILKKTTLLRALNQSVYYVACKIVVFVTLLVYVLTGGELTAEKVFVTLALYNNVRMTLTLFLPFGVAQLAEVHVALKRINEFLLLPEKNSSSSSEHPAAAANECSGVASVRLANLTAKWEGANENALSCVSLEARSGDLVGVVGAVGSGKSSLLQAILGELPGLSGTASVSGSIAYTGQEPWIVWGTVRDNILFGKPYDVSRYEEVTRVCALKSDFAQFPHGDNTFVGHKGASLSGGQKARISLARAVYSNADVYLLDDPLSAVDAKVARHIYNNCLLKFLSSKCVFLVTHQRHLVHSTTQMIYLVNGRVEPYEQAMELEERGDDDKRASPVQETHDQVDDEDHVAGIEEAPDSYELKGNPTTPNHDEVLQTNDITLDLYWKYIRSGSNAIGLFILVFSNVLAQVFYSGSDYYLKLWTNSNVRKSTSSAAEENEEPGGGFNVYVYAAIISALLVFSFLRTACFFSVCLRAGVNLHRKLLSSVMGTSLRFFETHPSGRILNRFSKDIGTMDDTLPLVFFDTVEVGLQVLGILIIVSIVNPLLTIPSMFVCIGFVFIRRLYLKTAQILKRLEGVARSPVLSHMSSTCHGLSLIRAFKAEQQSIQEFCVLQDTHSSSWYLVLATARWLGVTVDWLSILYIASVIVVIMLAHGTGSGGSGNADVGLALSSAVSLTGIMQWAVKQSSETANQIISVERVLEYSELQPEEDVSTPPRAHEQQQPPPSSSWPSVGRIVFKNVSLTYDQNNRVLNGINVTFEPGHKIGIIGRTGAGKSSLISALLRVVNPEGVIEIDGVPHSTVTLHQLRSSIAIIPQTPTLFNDTVRRNLAPLGCYQDHEIWAALDDVQLGAVIRGNSSGLDWLVEEDGSNFSAGQRQLFCLARVILRKCRIIVLDEATANMDSETDGIVQDTMKRKFGECTVVVVAHRINTVLDADRILMLEAGSVKEYDHPSVLLENPESGLSQLHNTSIGE